MVINKKIILFVNNYNFSYIFLIQIILIQLYGIKYSTLILIIQA